MENTVIAWAYKYHPDDIHIRNLSMFRVHEEYAARALGMVGTALRPNLLNLLF